LKHPTRDIDRFLNNLNNKIDRLWPEGHSNGGGNGNSLNVDNVVDPEEIAKWWYQEMKEQWIFHKSSWYMRGLNADDGVGCGPYRGCIPECEFYADEFISKV
jgi:hypothetical protein